MSEWQPIETAPRDGTSVLTYRKVGLMAVAEYIGSGQVRGWCCTDGQWLLNVTHWMPLPPAPGSATPPAPAVDVEEIITEARFLLDRLDEFEPEMLERDYCGHVHPSKSRLRALLAKLPKDDSHD